MAGKRARTFVVVLSPLVQVPIELEKLFVVLDHALPDRMLWKDRSRGDRRLSEDLLSATLWSAFSMLHRLDALRSRGIGLRCRLPPQRHPARGHLE